MKKKTMKISKKQVLQIVSGWLTKEKGYNSPPEVKMLKNGSIVLGKEKELSVSVLKKYADSNGCLDYRIKKKINYDGDIEYFVEFLLPEKKFLGITIRKRDWYEYTENYSDFYQRVYWSSKQAMFKHFDKMNFKTIIEYEN